MKLLLITLIALAIISTQAQYKNGINKVDPDTSTIIDGQGRQRIYHGGNVVKKNFPYQPTITEFNPINSYGQQDFDNLRKLGQNVIRYQVMWPGVFPQRDQVNTTYLASLEQQINQAGDNGVYTYLDMHQDLLSEKFCADGLPLWIFDEEDYASFAEPINHIYTFDENGFPNECGELPWSSYYFTYDVSQGFQNLYKNKQGFRDEWIKYWKTVAEYFKDNEYVIGYEIINEPWAGDIFKNPLLLYPGNADKWNLQGAYDKVADAIREVDDQHNLFFEPVTWLNTFATGFSHPPGGDQYADRSVFSYHYYQPPDILGMDPIMNQRYKDQQRLRVAGILSEFAVQEDDQPVFPPENNQLLDKCDEFLNSWTAWVYKPMSDSYDPENPFVGGYYYGNGTVIPSIATALSRTYAQAIAGQAIQMRFDTESKDFVLEYKICLTCGETVVYATDEWQYTNGVSINVTPTNQMLINKISDHRYTFKALDDSTLKEGDIVSIHITNAKNQNEVFQK